MTIFEQFNQGLISRGQLLVAVGIEIQSETLALIGAGMCAEEEREAAGLRPDLPPVPHLFERWLPQPR